MALALVLGAGCANDDSVDSIAGVVVEVESSGLTDVDSFSVRADDRTYEFIVTEKTEFAFAPAHLNEHRVSGEPVEVEFEGKDHGLYALSVADAS